MLCHSACVRQCDNVRLLSFVLQPCDIHRVERTSSDRVKGMLFFFFQAEDGIRDDLVTGVQTCALPISNVFRSVGTASGIAAPTERNTLAYPCVLAESRGAVENSSGGRASLVLFF